MVCPLHASRPALCGRASDVLRFSTKHAEDTAPQYISSRGRPARERGPLTRSRHSGRGGIDHPNARQASLASFLGFPAA